MLFLGYFLAHLGTELEGSQFGNPYCLHQSVKPHGVVPPWLSLPKSLSSWVAKSRPFPRNTRQSLRFSHTSCSLGGKNPQRWLPWHPALIPPIPALPSPAFPETTAKAMPVCKSSIICWGYIFIISDFNRVIQWGHRSRLHFYFSTVAIAAKVETKHIVHQSKVSWLMVFIFLYELTLEDSGAAANGNSNVFLSPLSAPLSLQQSR